MRQLIFRAICFCLSVCLFYNASYAGVYEFKLGVEKHFRVALAPKYARMKGKEGKPIRPEIPQDPYADLRQERLLALRLHQAVERGEVIAGFSPEAFALALSTVVLRTPMSFGSGFKPQNLPEDTPSPRCARQILNLSSGNLMTVVPLETGRIPLRFIHNSQTTAYPSFLLGEGWRLSWQWECEYLPGVAVLTDPSGAMHTVIEEGDEFFLPPELLGEFRRVGANEFVYQHPDGTKERFANGGGGYYPHVRTTFLSPDGAPTYLAYIGGSDDPSRVEYYFGGTLVQRLDFLSSPDRIRESIGGRTWDLVLNADRTLERLIKPAVDGVRYEVRIGYDSANNINRIIDANREVWETRLYDASDRLIRTQDLAGNPTTYDYRPGIEPGTQKTICQLPLGQTSESVSDLRTGLTYFGKDEAQFTWQVLDIDEHYNVEAFLDENGQTWLAEYDGLGNLTKSTDPEERESVTLYDEYSRPYYVEDEVGLITNIFYHPTNYALESVVDERGEIYRASNFTPAGLPQLEIDPGGLQKRTTYRPDGLVETSTAPGGYVTTYSYDNRFGAPTSARIPGITPGSVVYDALGRPEKAIGMEGPGEVSAHYDGEGRPVTLVDRSKRQTHFRYLDKESKLVAEFPDKTTSEVHFNENGWADTFTTPNKDTSRILAFTDRGEPWQIQDGGGTQQARSYFGGGETASVTTPLGEVNYQYDGSGMLKLVDNPGDEADVSFELLIAKRKGMTFTMSDGTGTSIKESNLFGQLTKQITQGTTIEYTDYSPADELKEMVVYDGDKALIYNWGHDKTSGELKEIRSPFGDVTAMSYNKLNGLPERIDHNRGKGPNEHFWQTYGYDAFGRTTSTAMYTRAKGLEVLARGQQITRFNTDGQPEVVQDTYLKDTATTTYAYHPLTSQVTSETRRGTDGGDYTWGYDYNANGALRSYTSLIKGVSRRTELDIDPGDRVSEMREFVGGTLDKRTTFGYDEHGRLNRQSVVGGDTDTYEFNFSGFLTGVSRNGQQLVNYEVNGLGTQVGSQATGPGNHRNIFGDLDPRSLALKIRGIRDNMNGTLTDPLNRKTYEFEDLFGRKDANLFKDGSGNLKMKYKALGVKGIQPIDLGDLDGLLLTPGTGLPNSVAYDSQLKIDLLGDGDHTIPKTGRTLKPYSALEPGTATPGTVISVGRIVGGPVQPASRRHTPYTPSPAYQKYMSTDWSKKERELMGARPAQRELIRQMTPGEQAGIAAAEEFETELWITLLTLPFMRGIPFGKAATTGAAAARVGVSFAYRKVLLNAGIAIRDAVLWVFYKLRLNYLKPKLAHAFRQNRFYRQKLEELAMNTTVRNKQLYTYKAQRTLMQDQAIAHARNAEKLFGESLNISFKLLDLFKFY